MQHNGNNFNVPIRQLIIRYKNKIENKIYCGQCRENIILKPITHKIRKNNIN